MTTSTPAPAATTFVPTDEDFAERNSLARIIARDVSTGNTVENNIYLAAYVKRFVELDDKINAGGW